MSSHPINCLRWNVSEEIILSMTFNAVFDESGKLNNSELVVFAGFFTRSTRWEDFGREWNTLLRKQHLTYFHMVEAVQMKGPFSKFRNKKAELKSLVTSLADLICKYAMEGSIQRISTAQFKGLGKVVTRRYKDPLYYAFESGIEELIKSPTLEPNDNFKLFCDDSDEYSSECLKVYRRLSKLKPEVAKRFGTICFGDDKSYSPLQAADMLAYSVRKVAVGDSNGLSTEVIKRFLGTFSDHSSDPWTLSKLK